MRSQSRFPGRYDGARLPAAPRMQRAPAMRTVPLCLFFAGCATAPDRAAELRAQYRSHELSPACRAHPERCAGYGPT